MQFPSINPSAFFHTAYSVGASAAGKCVALGVSVGSKFVSLPGINAVWARIQPTLSKVIAPLANSLTGRIVAGGAAVTATVGLIAKRFFPGSMLARWVPDMGGTPRALSRPNTPSVEEKK